MAYSYHSTVRSDVYLLATKDNAIHQKGVAETTSAFPSPFNRKADALLKRSNLSNVDEKTKLLLDGIAKNCAACQTYSTKPQRFKVSIPSEKVVFNREVALDLMWL